VLMQQGHPLAFISKALGPITRGLSTYEKEYLTILIVVDHWRTYLQLAKFVILIDQKSLIHFAILIVVDHWRSYLQLVEVVILIDQKSLIHLSD
jgi:hypothetical protein